MAEIKLNKKELRTLEKKVIKRIDEIIFEERERPSREPKKNGMTIIESDTGKLKDKLHRNRNFIKQGDKGFEINLRMMPYYVYLDDGRRDELNWYLTEAIFEDEQINNMIAELLEGAMMRVFLEVLTEADKNN
jgi:hypothetical protein